MLKTFTGGSPFATVELLRRKRFFAKFGRSAMNIPRHLPPVPYLELRDRIGASLIACSRTNDG